MWFKKARKVCFSHVKAKQDQECSGKVCRNIKGSACCFSHVKAKQGLFFSRQSKARSRQAVIAKWQTKQWCKKGQVSARQRSKKQVQRSVPWVSRVEGLTLREAPRCRFSMQTIVDACGCHARKQSDSRDRGLISSLTIPYCANSLLYMDFIHGLPRFGGYDSCLVVTCGLSRFTRVFPCNKKITGEQTVKMLVEQWFEPYGAPKQVHSDEDVRIRSDTGWYKRVLSALNVEVSTGVPYTHTSNPLCERQNRVVEQNLRILMKQERTNDWVRLVPWAVLTMNSKRSSSTGFTPDE